MAKRESLFRAVTRPLSILLFWQSLGWIGFGILEPSISEKVGTPSNAGLVLIVSLVMTGLTATLGAIALYLWRSTDQKDFRPKLKTHHKCRNCGYSIETGTAMCPHCGSKTLF
jgi:DNA-directed RNA polymerase subunit RPC12/RpoP